MASSAPDSTPFSLGDITAALGSSTDKRDKTLVIRQLTPEIVIFSTPFSRFGTISIGGRSTAIKLPSNEIFVYVSTPHTPATQETLKRMGGEVKYLVTPDGEHGMYIQEFVDAYPNAKPIGVARYKDKKPGINWAGLFGLGGESQQYGFEPHISLHQVSSHMNDELVAIHHPSGTLLEADMVFNLPATEQYSRAGGLAFFGRTFGSHLAPGTSFHSGAASAVTTNKVKIKEELKPISAATWDRLIPCHGEVIETNGKVEWNKVWAKYE